MNLSTSIDFLKVELASACSLIGKKNPFWTQGGGGNVSIKADDGSNDILLIKSSGFRLDQVTSSVGIASLSLSHFVDRFKNLSLEQPTQVEELYSALIEESSVKAKSRSRPSMETGFHALLSGRLVTHFHSLAAQWIAEQVSRGDDSWIKKLGAEAVYLPAAMPGYELSMQAAQHPDKSIYILKNHGVILNGSDIGIIERWADFERDYFRQIDFAYPSWVTDLSGTWGNVPAAPLRLLFPDMVILRDRIRKILVLDSVRSSVEYYKMIPNAEKADLDAAEIWIAGVLLQTHDPNMAELPDSISAGLSGLPVEKLRLQLMSPQNGSSS